MKDYKILFKFATRSRPELFKRGLKSINDNCISDNYTVLVSADIDDLTMQNIGSCKNCVLVFSRSESKIHAINRDMELIPDWDIVINMSDDMTFIHHGFDNIIRESFDSLDQCLHFPDGNRNDLITLSILGRQFYEKFNYIYNPEYKSLYCDNEQTEVAQTLGLYKFIDNQIFEHLHPAYGKSNFDIQYQRTESFNEVDKQTYLRRKGINFGL